MTALVYVAAALAEIARCFAFWACFRLGQPAWWLVPGLASQARRLARARPKQRHDNAPRWPPQRRVLSAHDPGSASVSRCPVRAVAFAAVASSRFVSRVLA